MNQTSSEVNQSGNIHSRFGPWRMAGHGDWTTGNVINPKIKYDKRLKTTVQQSIHNIFQKLQHRNLINHIPSTSSIARYSPPFAIPAGVWASPPWPGPAARRPPRDPGADTAPRQRLAGALRERLASDGSRASPPSGQRRSAGRTASRYTLQGVREIV